MKVESYLFFEGRCEEAIEYYRRTLGAEVLMMMRNKESPEPPHGDMARPGMENKILHAHFRVGDTSIMASDGNSMGNANFQGFSLALSVATAADATRVFAALGDGGQVQQPLTKTFFSPSFGMVKDRFGMQWMVLVMGPS